MASQLYSRYVPQKKKKEVSSQQSATLPAPETNATAFETKHDASSTYARYVPSKSKTKRRKLEDAMDASFASPVVSPAVVSQDVGGRRSQIQLLKLTEGL
jgi:hypothetical protein